MPPKLVSLPLVLLELSAIFCLGSATGTGNDFPYPSPHYQKVIEAKLSDRALFNPRAERPQYQKLTEADSSNRAVSSPRTERRLKKCGNGLFHKAVLTVHHCLPCPRGRYQNKNNHNSNTCKGCPLGYHQASPGSSSCDECPEGKYQHQPNKETCRNCPAGKYSDDTRRTRAADCIDCPSGKYSSTPATVTCDECPEGKYQHEPNKQECHKCTAGKYNDVIGQTAAADCSDCSPGKHSSSLATVTCDDCDAGKYAASAGQSICRPCDPGYYSTSGQGQSDASTCIDCQAGRYSTAGEAQTDPNVCQLCEEGRYSTQQAATNDATCVACASGKYSEGEGESDASTCIDCVAGTYSTAGPAQTDESVCQLCDAGTYSTELGRTSATACKDCGVGQYTEEGAGQSNSSSCKLCVAGKHSSTLPAALLESKCEPCGPNKYGPDAGLAECFDCPGTPNATTAIKCEGFCAPGKYVVGDDCEDCPLGYEALGVHAEECNQCPEGKYGMNLGPGNIPRYQCQFCDLGQWSSTLGATNDSVCHNCAAGKKSGDVPAISIDDCHNCEPGQYSDKKGVPECDPCVAGKFAAGSSSTTCTSCPTGWKGPTQGSDFCEPCQKGFYQSEESKDLCDHCTPGYYSSSETQALCTSCLAGTFQSSSGGQSCKTPSAGYYVPKDNASVATPCQSGTYGRLELFSRVDCGICPAGWNQPDGGTTECHPCDDGTYQNNDGRTFCYPCPAGKRDSENKKKCHGCPIGYHQPESGETFCDVCDEGTYQDRENQTFCSPCSSGQFQPEAGKDLCNACPTGWYNPVSGETDCTECLQGSYQHVSGQTSCSTCSGGQYQSEQGQQKCQGCTPGQFQVDVNSTGCAQCPTGYSMKNHGSTLCFPCVPGRYQHQIGQSSCLDCEKHTTSENSQSETCQDCPLGKLADQKGSTSCTNCASGFYGSRWGECTKCPLGKIRADFHSTTKCVKCNDVGKRPNDRQTSCESPSWGTCTPGTQYLHDFPEKDTTKWKCENCPAGGNCSGSRTLKQVTGQRGYLRMSFDNQTFGKCLNYRACSNKNMNRTGLCLEGHHGELCSQCLTEWSKSSQTEPCTRCEDSGLTVVIFVGAILVAMAVFTFLVWDNLDGAREMIPSQDGTKSPTAMPFHSIAIRIVSSYLQVSGMLLRFDLTLPKSVQALIQVESGASSLGERLLMFECMTHERDDFQLFLMRQIAMVWVIPLASFVCCFVFWFILFRRKWSFDGFVASLMVLFYTLFPSIVTRVALTSSCRSYGTRLLLTEALSVQCYSNKHSLVISAVGIPGLIVFVLMVPFALAKKLIQQRKKQTLYHDQQHYNPKWTLRYGFIFAGYRHGFEWWESIIMMRKCCFVLLSIFLGAYGATAQCVASSMILVAALSLQLQYRPFLDDDHNQLESIGLHACLLQLLVALMSNSVGKVGHSSLGPMSTAVLIVVMFGSSISFFWWTVRVTVQSSKHQKGAIGMMSKACGGCCGKKKGARWSSITRSGTLKRLKTTNQTARQSNTKVKPNEVKPNEVKSNEGGSKRADVKKSDKEMRQAKVLNKNLDILGSMSINSNR